MSMNKLIEVREFEMLTCNDAFKEDNKYHYLPPQIFQELKLIIYELAEEKPELAILEFLRIRSHRGVGEVISVSNYVGLIQLTSGYRIQVLPKISFDTEENSTIQTKRIFLKMLRSLKDFPSKFFNEANLMTDKMNLYEIFINLYLKEVRQLVKKGLKASYLETEDNLNYYKGKLLFSEQIKRNLVHQQRCYVSYDEYGVNRSENRIIKSTLIYLLKQTTSHENQKEIRQLLTFFEKVQLSTNYEKDFCKITINRQTKDYELLIQWSKIFLLKKGFTMFSGVTTNQALLFPMEKVFESYMTQQLKRLLNDLDWEVLSQHKGYFLFDNPQQFALRPDIVINANEGRQIIMDMKWKRLIPNARSNYGISQNDMYQMYAYAKKYQTSEIWLLYPLHDEIRHQTQIIFESNDEVKVYIYFIDLVNIEDCLSRLKTNILSQATLMI